MSLSLETPCRDPFHQILCRNQLEDILLLDMIFGRLGPGQWERSLLTVLSAQVQLTSIPTLALSPPLVFREAAANFLTIEFSR